jgi:hypothetical protein
LLKKSWVRSSGLALLGLALLSLALEAGVHFQCRLLHPHFQCGEFPNSHHSGLSVLILGDSWATHTHLAEGLRSELGEATVRSDGHPGATSKAVYIDAFGQTGCKSATDIFSGVTYAVIVVGVNDVVGHKGADFYSHHLSLLVRSLQSRHIRPVIVLLPRVGIGHLLRENGPWYREAKHSLFWLIMDRGRGDTIDRYRTEFLHQPEAHDIVIVNPDNVIGSYSHESSLWANPIHLSSNGDEALGKMIGLEILSDVSKGH